MNTTPASDAGLETQQRGQLMAPAPFTLPQLTTYPGGKGADGTYQRLINDIPPHHTFISLFLGNCGVLRHKRPARINIGVELDELVVDAWSDAPQWVSVRHQDAFRFLEQQELPRNTFLFVDPPYINETLARNGYYRHNFTLDQHFALLDRLKQLRCMVMVCSLPNLYYENRLGKWRTFQYENKTRRGMQTEQVWCNYPEPTALHDYRYVGRNYREREALKRTSESILDFINYYPKSRKPRPHLERMALLHAIKQANP